MYLQKIKIKGFKSIYDELVLDFENDIKGFWKINGTVGSGKTSIGEAIIFGLYGDIKGKNNSDLISWGEKHCIIEVWCKTKGYSLYIKREINRYGLSPIYAEVNGEELIFTNKRNAQKQLEDEYYDISRITLELLCIISFNNFKSLANLNANDTKQFLDRVFGFYILTNYGDKCKLFKQEVSNSINNLNININNLQDQIDRLNRLSNVEIIEGNINTLKNDLNLLNQRYTIFKQEKSSLSEKHRDELISLQSKLSEVKTLGVNVKKEIDFIKKGICPTCGAPIDQSQLEEKNKIRNTLLESYNNLDSQIKKLNDDYNKIKWENEVKEKEINAEITSIHSKISQLKEQEKRLNISKDEINLLEKQQNEFKIELSKKEIDKNDWDILYDILTIDIRQKILSSFIPLLNNSIQDYATQFKLPYNIKFDNTFKCNVKLYGTEQDIPISMLSTGQMKVVNISIILGILKTIMSSVNFNICLLDELLSNMHSELRYDICKVLKDNIKDNQTIFIISHAELDDEHFDGSLDVELVFIDSVYQKSKYTKNNLN
jgi:DNA repair exonuclease SbcCD ATPase subunit